MHAAWKASSCWFANLQGLPCSVLRPSRAALKPCRMPVIAGLQLLQARQDSSSAGAQECTAWPLAAEQSRTLGGLICW